jgi:hypothetical protein
MNMQTEAPDLTPGYPSKGARLGPAWKDVWAILQRDPGTYLDAWVIADEVAPTYDMSPLSIVQLMSRAAEAGILEREHRPVTTSITRVHKGRPTTRPGTRLRSHYRIKP